MGCRQSTASAGNHRRRGGPAKCWGRPSALCSEVNSQRFLAGAVSCLANKVFQGFLTRQLSGGGWVCILLHEVHCTWFLEFPFLPLDSAAQCTVCLVCHSGDYLGFELSISGVEFANLHWTLYTRHWATRPQPYSTYTAPLVQFYSPFLPLMSCQLQCFLLRTLEWV